MRSLLAGSIGLFFLCGFTTVLNDTLTPYLQASLGLDYTQVAWLPGVFYLAYFLASPITGHIYCNRDPTAGMRSGAAIACAGAALIGLTSTMQSYPAILAAVFVLGVGIAMIQVCTNLSVVTAADEQPSAARLTLTQAFTNAGTLLAPAYGAALMLGRMDQSTPLLGPYLAVAAAWVALLLALRKLPPSKPIHHTPTPLGELLRDRAVRYGFVFIPLAVGIEIAIASYLTQFLLLQPGMHLTLEAAGKLTILFWGGFLVGRLVAHRLLLTIAPARLLTAHALAGAVLAAVAVAGSGMTSVVAVLGLGLCCSVLFPILYTLVIQNTRVNPSQVSGLLCMGNLGGALLPMLQGVLADRIGLHTAFLVPAAALLLLALAVQRFERGQVPQTLSLAGSAP